MSPPEGFHLWRPHPWHGLSIGPEPPGLVHAYVEICPSAVRSENGRADNGVLECRSVPSTSQ